MVKSKVPHARVHHPVRAERHHAADDRAGDAVIPVRVLVDRLAARDQHRAQQRREDRDQLPQRRLVVGPELELRIQIQKQKPESRERGRRGPIREGLERSVDLIGVAGADGAVVHDEAQPGTEFLGRCGGHDRRADGEEVRGQAADEPFEEDLDERGGDEGVQEADGGVAGVPEGADAGLHGQDGGDGEEGGEEHGGVEGDDGVAQRVGELRVDDVARGEGDGEGARGRGARVVEAEGEGTEDGHG